jgi:uncharacterized protein with HEPN domain
MQRDLRVYLWDLQKALSEISSFVEGKSFDTYVQELILQRAIERNFITVGEILSRILHYFPETKDRIEHARKITNFRNVLVHEYAHVKDDVVWKVATVSAPVLKLQIDLWLKELDQT